jgi:Protein of unknown function (DUF2480)
MQNNDKPLVNRVAKSGLITFVLENLAPKIPFVIFDIKDYLWQGLVLREKDFRTALKEYDWQAMENHIVCITCSADAIVPTWAFMLVASNAQPHASRVFHGTREEFLTVWFENEIDTLDTDDFADAIVVIKGCGGNNVPDSAYVTLVTKLQPHVRSLMFGEPCSTVPLFKRPKI